MADAQQRVLSEHPLNAEPSTSTLISSFFTPTSAQFHRNHGEWVDEPADYALRITCEASGLPFSASTLSIDLLKRFPKESIVALLACAGNRRNEMSAEKKTEGLQWGKSAISNSHFAGVLLRDVLAHAGIKLDQVEAQGKADELHVHFETSQNCEEDTFYGSSLPIRMALDPERPVLLAYEMNDEPLARAHGAPLRLVVPGVIGARSVKWLERIVIRDRESDCFYQQRDYKVLPPEATPETKEKHLKQLPALMEFPLSAEICEPEEGATVSPSGNSKIRVKGYAVGSKGIPIASVRIALLPLPVPPHPSPFAATTPELASSEVHQIRLLAVTLPEEAWVEAELDAGPGSSERGREKHWGWTLFSADVPTSALAGRGDIAEAALVAYATGADGQVQEVQTEWNLRGVAEASWSVVKVELKDPGL